MLNLPDKERDGGGSDRCIMTTLLSFRNTTRNYDELRAQFMNATLEGYATLSGVWHHSTIPYSKEENGIERANKEVNRHIRNILFDKECFKNWPQMLCMTVKLLKSSVKQPLGESPNTLLFGNAVLHEPSFIEELDQAPKNATPVSIRENVDDFIQRQGKLLNAAMTSQEATN